MWSEGYEPDGVQLVTVCVIERVATCHLWIILGTDKGDGKAGSVEHDPDSFPMRRLPRDGEE